MEQENVFQMPVQISKFAALKAAAWSQIKGNILTLFLVMIVWGAIMSMLQVPSSLQYAGVSVGILATFGIAFTVIAAILDGVMQYGYAANQSKMFKGEPATFGTAFSGFKAGAMIVAFLRTLFTVLWTILFIIPGIIKSYSYGMAMYIYHDDDTKNPNDCITESRDLMYGHKWRLFTYDLWFFLLIIGALFLTLGIGLIWVIPYLEQTRYNFYQDIKKNYTCAGKLKPVQYQHD